ncbi:LOW QUALITY PROTEIN: UDP-glucuronosyltransferase 2A2-like [Haliotis rubra]|uniref:LOW QUALITY PROTEIN: UDP-glucuronosyltransferase 2A2-like n=1 Tax=Haliotis rubra TaxID=36100 RepID=UPI001EE630BB|nr:LOW QUALITY PROTEIN: UDP-glucuronosyltransferase 2A2-like [Haliotis rubra]
MSRQTYTVTSLMLMVIVARLDAASILFLFFPEYSHIRGCLPVAAELAARGHVVWNALPSYLANREGLQVSGVNILKYKSVDGYDIEADIFDKTITGFFEQDKTPPLFDEFRKICDMILRDTNLFHAIEKLNLDLIVFDSTPLPRMLTIIAYKLDVPFIFYGTFFEAQASRTPLVLASDPSRGIAATTVMDFGHRMFNFIVHSMYYISDPFSYPDAVGIYAPEMPYVTMETLTANGWLWLIVKNLFEYPKATLPSVKFVGSTSSADIKPLPEPYRTFVEGKKEPVIIVSFGSKVRLFPDKTFRLLLDAFTRTKYNYVFKTSKKINTAPNIMLTDWMPQSDLLAHPNTKLFITHCGAYGQNEAFLHGVPMIGFPMFAEQPYNAKKLGYFGFGMAMDLKTFTVDDLVFNINEVIQNSSYSRKIKKAAEITKLRERSPKDEAVYWIEHVLKYGGAHLRSYCQDMPLYQYLCLDVIGLVLLILHVCVFLLWKSCSFCYRTIVHGPKEKRE